MFHFFGYAYDSPELRALRIKQANLVGPAGYLSMEDTEATKLDRVLSLRHASIDDAHTNRHVTSGLRIQPVDSDTVTAESSYVVIQTRSNGESFVYLSNAG